MNSVRQSLNLDKLVVSDTGNDNTIRFEAEFKGNKTMFVNSDGVVAKDKEIQD